MSITNIEYVKDKQELQIISRLFIDDLEKTLRERYSDDLILNYGQDEDVIEQALKSCKLVHAGVQTNPESSFQLAEMNKAAEAYYYETRATMILSGVYVGFMAEKFAQQ